MSLNLFNFDDEPDVCIGIFKARSKFAKYREENFYEINLTNCSNNIRKLLISFDIYRFYTSKSPVHPHDHHAFFNKWITLNPNSTKLQIKYDWSGDIKFIINGSEEKYDERWIAPMNEEGLYSIHLVLLDKEQIKKSELVLIQELTKPKKVQEEIKSMFSILKLVNIDNLAYLEGYNNLNKNNITKKDKNIILLQGKDRKMIHKTIDYFSLYQQRESKNLRLFVPYLDDDVINKVKNTTRIISSENLSYEEALKSSILLCDPSIDNIDLSSVINAWLNQIPLLVHEKSLLKDLCTITNSCLYFNNYQDFEACVDFFSYNNLIREKIEGNAVQHGIELYNWIKFLDGLKQYIFESDEI